MIAVSDQAREHIAEIRRTKFHIGDGGLLISKNPLSEDLKNSIAHLSEGLYSEDVHFIFELIQNAEDNAYKENVEPSLTFRLVASDPTKTDGSDGALIIENNEIGFSPDNVKALCSVGTSTKTKQEGYIGEKGIGFKSVFQVTTNPHLFSNGYAFSFPERDEITGLGYIVPYWIEHIPAAVNTTGTTIILPLKQNKHKQIRQQLEQIAPETILFLKKIKSLNIVIEDDYQITILKDDTKAPLVELIFEAANETAKESDALPVYSYWVETCVYERPPGITAIKREKVYERSVTVALPLSHPERSTGKVFAYLPTRLNTGLPFLINADFILPSSREDIKIDEAWNHWLRDEVTPTFVSAFEKLLHHPSYGIHAYQYIPLEKQVKSDFFRSVVASTHESLAKRSVVHLEHSDCLVKPEQASLAPSPKNAFRTIFCHDSGPEALQQRPLVRAAIEAYEPQRRAIGLKQFHAREIIKCLRDKAWLSKRSLKWFLKCYDYLKGQDWGDSTNASLRDCPITPVEGNRLTCDSEQPIYFPLSGDDRKFVATAPDRVRAQFAVLDSNLYEMLSESAELKNWLTNALAIYPFNPGNYCVDIINKLVQDSDNLDDITIIASTRFLALYAPANVTYERFPIILDSGKRKRLASITNLVTPRKMDAKTGWQNIFDAPDECSHLAVLSDLYLEEHGVEVTSEELLEFLKSLGMTDAPPLKRREVNEHSYPQSSYERQKFAEYQGIYSTYPKTISNYAPPKWLVSLAEGGKPNDLKQKSRSMMAWLERRLEDPKYVFDNGFDKAWLSYFYRTSKFETFESEFLHYLKATPWLLSTDNRYKIPIETFVDNPTIRSILGNKVAYISEITPKSVRRLLGIREEMTAKEALSLLRDLSGKEAEKALVHQIYRYLSTISVQKLAEQFGHGRLVYLPNTAKKWFAKDEIIWLDRSNTLGDDFGYLEKIYPDLEAFFIKKLGVARDAGPKNYADKWLQLASQDPAEPQAIAPAMTRIFQALLPVCQKIQNGEAPPEWWQHFADEMAFWTQGKTFRFPKDVYVPDDRDLKKLFAAKGVAFVWKPENEAFASYEPLYRKLGVPYLSESITVEMAKTNKAHMESDLGYLTKSAQRMIVAHFYHGKQGQNDWQRLRDEGLLKALAQAKEFVVDGLTVEFRLDDYVVEEACAAYWDRTNGKLYLEAHQGQEVRDEVAEALAKGLMGNRPFRDLELFIYRALCTSEEDEAKFLEKRGWNLPVEVRREFDSFSETAQSYEPGQSSEELEVDEVVSASSDRHLYNHRIHDSDPTFRGEGSTVSGSSGRESSRPEIGDKDSESDEHTTTQSRTTGSRTPHEKTSKHGSTRETAQQRDRPPGTPSDSRSHAQETERAREWRTKPYVYVAHKSSGESDSADSSEQARRMAISAAAVARVMKEERNHGRIPEEMNHSNEGFDILSCSADGEVLRYIEVKGIDGPWGELGVSLSRKQFFFDRGHRELFWLYVVEHALDPDRSEVHMLQDPASVVTSFRFAAVWKDLAK